MRIMKRTSGGSEKISVVLALVLSAMAAVLSAPVQGPQAAEGVTWLLTASTEQEVVAAAGAIGEVEQWALPPAADARDGALGRGRIETADSAERLAKVASPRDLPERAHGAWTTRSDPMRTLVRMPKAE
jgi:hypothetical protein